MRPSHGVSPQPLYTRTWFAFVATVLLEGALIVIHKYLGLRLLPLAFTVGPLIALLIGLRQGLASASVPLAVLTFYFVFPHHLPAQMIGEDIATVRMVIFSMEATVLLLVIFGGRHKHRIDELLERITLQANQDALTGLASRRHGQERLEQEGERARRDGAALSVVLFDIDHFKAINDTFGHPTGDAVLAELGALVREGLRGYDPVTRWGGEEFLLALPGAAERDAASVAERLRAVVAGHPFREHLSVTVSAGVATLAPGDTSVTLLNRADARLYQAKLSGRNRTVAAEHSAPPPEALPPALPVK